MIDASKNPYPSVRLLCEALLHFPCSSLGCGGGLTIPHHSLSGFSNATEKGENKHQHRTAKLTDQAKAYCGTRYSLAVQRGPGTATTKPNDPIFAPTPLPRSGAFGESVAASTMARATIAFLMNLSAVSGPCSFQPQNQQCQTSFSKRHSPTG